MANQSNPSTPQLQKPGAGLPWVEALIARYLMMPWTPRRTPWKASNDYFIHEGEKILKLLSRFDPSKSVDAETLERPVLIPRIRGIEDSSRFWSISMTLEHLITVGQGMTHIICELTHGRVPPIQVNIAQVKPSKKLQAQNAASEFQRFLKETHRNVSQPGGNLASPARLVHPWFGPITAHQWNWLLASHQGIHRRQIEQIILLLNKTGT